jgi:hypothetical protein
VGRAIPERKGYGVDIKAEPATTDGFDIHCDRSGTPLSNVAVCKDRKSPRSVHRGEASRADRPAPTEADAGQTNTTRGEGREKLGTKKLAIGGSLCGRSSIGLLEFCD